MTEARRIIEALRCGIPNAQAVEVLGSHQPLIESRFQRLLSEPQSVPAGLVISGGFGTGKSHTLEFLYQQALRQNFVCSRITINKETPLHDPSRLFRAAAGSAVVPGRCGNGIREAARSIDYAGDRYRELSNWTRSNDLLIDSRLGASLAICESPKSESEARDRILQFWSGDPIGSAYVRDCLRQVRPSLVGPFRTATQKDLALQKFQFVSRLILSAGYRGWVVLVDEVELIGCYSQLQRARSYCELARFAGCLPTFTCPQSIFVFAMTDDFDAAVLERKGDFTQAPTSLAERPPLADLAPLSKLGMNTIRSGALTLTAPEPSEMGTLYGKLKVLHGEAYGWNPPEVGWPERLSTTRVRQYVKSWITEWDMSRMYPGENVVIEQVDVTTDYAENIDEGADSVDSGQRRSSIDEILDNLL